jgi:pyruvate/2-oxoglutarate dehydrogenase complex dihydrolipoamide acyltransferase (E2) component
MKLLSKLKLFFALTITIIIVSLLGLYLSYSLSHKDSFEASIAADTFQVGSTFAGTITDITVQEGDTVSIGQTVATIQSPDIAEAIIENRISDNNSFKVTDDQTIALLSSQPGTVREILFSRGSFVSSSDVIIKLDEISDPYVEAIFKLLPPDYDRVTTSTKLVITLPNNDTFEAEVDDITIQRTQDENEEGIDTLIKAIPTNTFSDQRKFPVGTPLKTRMFLQDERSFISNLKNRLTDIF